MKKLVTITFTVALLFSLVGCGEKIKDVETEPLTAKINDESIKGNFTGTIEKNLPQGNGKIAVTGDLGEWTYEGAWESGAAVGEGKLAGREIEFTFNDKIAKGIYNGEAADGLPNGKGTVTVGSGTEQWSYDGNWEKGKCAGEGSVVNMPIKLEVCVETIDAAYKGNVKSFLADGEGTVGYEKDDKYFKYEGGFSAGKMSGKGQIESNIYSVKFPEVTHQGIYKGDSLDGLASGKGEFSAVTEEDVAYTYTGEWENGLFNGQGVQKFDDANYYVRTGTFKDGVFSPTLSERFKSLGTYEGLAYTVSEPAVEFIEAHGELFPANKLSEIEEYVDESISFKHLKKSPADYGSSLTHFSNYSVVQISEEEIWGEKYSVLILYSSDYKNVAYLYYPGELDVFDNDIVEFYALPLGKSSYENTGGGTTICHMFLGSYITK